MGGGVSACAWAGKEYRENKQKKVSDSRILFTLNAHPPISCMAVSAIFSNNGSEISTIIILPANSTLEAMEPSPESRQESAANCVKKHTPRDLNKTLPYSEESPVADSKFLIWDTAGVILDKISNKISTPAPKLIRKEYSGIYFFSITENTAANTAIPHNATISIFIDQKWI